MESNIFFFGITVALIAALAFYINKKFSELSKGGEDNSMKMMLQLISETRRDIQNGHGESRKELDDRLHKITMMLKAQESTTSQRLEEQHKQSMGMIQEMTKNLTQVKEGTKQVASFAEQMKSLENILKNPKQRGILGEYALETLLSNHLHGNYQMQYRMQNGEIVDAVIFFNNLIIPIDSKFSLEKYNEIMQATDADKRAEHERAFRSDVKKRIDETAKYIRPEEGTTEFAFMFVPAEGIYYNLTVQTVGGLSVNTQNLMEYAFGKRVIIVSPSSFFAYLQTVLQGMKALEMGENITKTLKGIEILGKHVNAYDDYFQKLGKHLGTTVNTYNSASREFKKIDKDVFKLTDGEIGGRIEPLLLDKPVEDN